MVYYRNQWIYPSEAVSLLAEMARDGQSLDLIIALAESQDINFAVHADVGMPGGVELNDGAFPEVHAQSDPSESLYESHRQAAIRMTFVIAQLADNQQSQSQQKANIAQLQETLTRVMNAKDEAAYELAELDAKHTSLEESIKQAYE